MTQLRMLACDVEAAGGRTVRAWGWYGWCNGMSRIRVRTIG